MAGLNKVQIIGNLGADPELRATQSGNSVCNIRVAVNETWNDKNGQKQERVEWFRVTIWGKQGEVAAQYLAKGRKVYVEGRLQTSEYTDKDGNQRQSWEIVASNVIFIDNAKDGGGGQQGGGGGGWGGGGNQGGGQQSGGGGWGGQQGGGQHGGGGGGWGGGGGQHGGGGGGWGGGGGGGNDHVPF